jgi:hypothetical protein
LSVFCPSEIFFGGFFLSFFGGSMLGMFGFSPIFWIVSFAIQAVVKQLAKFGAAHDWAQTKAYVAQKVAVWVPGTLADGVAVEITDTLVDALQMLTQSGKAITEIVEDVLKKDWQEALKDVADLVAAVGKEVAPNAGELADKLRKHAA